MGKFMFALLTVLGIELAIFLFGGGTNSNTSLFGMLFNPASFPTNPFFLGIAGAILLTVGTAIIPGNLYQLNQLGLYGIIASTIFTFFASIASLGTFVYGQLTEIGISSALLITTIITSPIAIVYAT